MTKLTESEFIKIVKSVNPTIYKKHKDYNHCYLQEYNKNQDINLDEHYLYIQWVIGGVTGGSCWDSGDEDYHYKIDTEKELTFTDLINVLEKINPIISYSKYVELEKNIIKSDSRRDYEYYGNYTDYKYKYVLLRDLFNFLNTSDLCK